MEGRRTWNENPTLPKAVLILAKMKQNPGRRYMNQPGAPMDGAQQAGRGMTGRGAAGADEGMWVNLHPVRGHGCPRLRPCWAGAGPAPGRGGAGQGRAGQGAERQASKEGCNQSLRKKQEKA